MEFCRPVALPLLASSKACPAKHCSISVQFKRTFELALTSLVFDDPNAFDFIERNAWRGLERVLCRIDRQPSLTFFFSCFDGFKRYSDFLVAYAKESSDRDNYSFDVAASIEEKIFNFADFLLVRIIDGLCVEIRNECIPWQRFQEIAGDCSVMLGTRDLRRNRYYEESQNAYEKIFFTSISPLLRSDLTSGSGKCSPWSRRLNNVFRACRAGARRAIFGSRLTEPEVSATG
jgi:hypothetical protein